MNCYIDEPDIVECILRGIGVALLSIHSSIQRISWEDFLDFSKMSLTWEVYSVQQRLQKNVATNFAKPYFLLMILIPAIVGMVLKSKVLIAMPLSLMIWVCLFVCAECDYLKKDILSKTSDEAVVS